MLTITVITREYFIILSIKTINFVYSVKFIDLFHFIYHFSFVIFVIIFVMF